MSNVLKHLIPPSDPDDDRVTNWRWFTVIGLVSVAITLSFHISAAKGLVPWLTGYALASEMERQSTLLGNMERRQLEQSIRDIRKDNCAAISNDNAKARELTAERLQEYLGDYGEATGREYQLLDCDET